MELKADGLRAIVNDNLLWYAKVSYDILPDEILDFVVLDLMESLSFNPLREVVGDRDHVNPLAWGRWEFADDVHPPLHEWPWGDDGGKLIRWKVCHLGEAMAAVALLDEKDGVKPQGRPIVASSQGSVGQAASFGVITTLPFMKYCQDVVSLYRCHTLEVWT